MKMYRKSILISAVVLIVGIMFIIFSLNKYKGNLSEFENDGHIIIYNNSNTYEKYNFNEKEEYRIVNNAVVFNDNENVKREVSTDNFIHYTNGSIAVFKKAVILNFEDLKRDTYRYYNVFEDQVLTKKGKSYEIDYIGGKLSFQNFMIKIAANKYLIIGSNISFTMNGEVKKFEDTFLEVSFLDGDIVRLCNDGFFTQNISSNMYLNIGDIKIDLSNQNVELKDTLKMNLSEVTIDKDDNIVIPVTKTIRDGSSYSTNGGNNESGNNGSGNGNNGGSSSNGEGGSGGNVVSVSRPVFPNVSSGIVSFEPNETEEIIDENARIKDAVFTVSSFTPEVNSLRGHVEISDEEGTLTGDIVVKVIDTTSNNVVYEKVESSGYSNFDIEVDNLIPNTNYILVANSNYEKNGVSYNKDFIQKTFVTKSLGLSIEKDYVTSHIMSLDILKNKYSTISQVDAILYSPNGTVLRTESINLDDREKANVIYTNLDNNSTYTVKLTNYVYSNYSVSGLSDITETFKTLKENPTIGESSFKIDKTNGTFTLNVGSVVDRDSGILSYRYEVYDARTYSPTATPISSIERDKPTSVTVSIDNVNYKREIPYVFKVITTFDDNEKIIEIESPMSDAMMIDGVEFPSVAFGNDLTSTYESITGTLIISDPGNTIRNLQSKSITIVYTSSVGERRSLTSLGTLEIPINRDKVNNLRANETYTFSVYATVDLYDGNPPIDNCFIGSAIVKTGTPNGLKVNYGNNDSTSRNVFSVETRLVDYNVDATLEAETLTGLRFNLYSGNGTGGELLASVLKVDRNLLPYVSDLKEEYYDSSFVLTPEFFNKNNNDLYANTYTIEITNAYDYTDYKNEIPLYNNVMVIGANPYVPTYPKDPNNTIELDFLKNADLGNNRRQDLLDTTLIGVRMRALYDNSRKYAKKIHYFLHDGETDEVLQTYDYDVPFQQDPEFVYFYFDDGIPFNQHDDKIRRGGNYYFSYTVELDTDDDGEVDMLYPSDEDDIILRSQSFRPAKQKPTFLAYPSKTENDGITLKYYYNDVDHASVNNILNIVLGGELIEQIPLISFENETFESLKINTTNAGMLVLSTEVSSYNEWSEQFQTSALSFYTQYYSGIIPTSTCLYQIYTENNRLRINFTDYESNVNFYDRVAKYELVFTDLETQDTITMNDVDFNNGAYYVDFMSLADFIGHEIKIDVKLYVDLGYYGFDIEGDYFALQSLKTSNNKTESYYHYDNNGRLSMNTLARSSFFTYSMDHENKTLYLYSIINPAWTSNMNLRLDSGGYSFNYDYVSPKKLTEVHSLPYDSLDTFTFSNIIPGISLTNDKGLFDISPTITGVNFKARLYGIMANHIKDDYIYTTVYDVDSIGNTTELMTVRNTIDEFSNIISIEGLQDNHTYKLRFSADILGDNGEYVRGYLYDFDTGETGREYTFKTSSSVGINNVNINYYNPQGDYNDRQLKISYELDQLTGFQYIKYIIEMFVTNADGSQEFRQVEGLEIPNSRQLRNSMAIYVPIPVDCGIFTNQTYRLTIIPIKELTVDGETAEFELDKESKLFSLDDLYKPYVYSKSSFSTVDGSVVLDLNISIRDYNGAVVNNTFELSLLNSDNQDITPDEYRDVSYSTLNGQNIFRISGVEVGQEYTAVIKYSLNQTNNSQDNTEIEAVSHIIVRNSYGISTGTIYTRKSSTDSSKVVLQFMDSQKIDRIKKIRYSIYSSQGENMDNQTFDFLTSQKSLNGTVFYEYELPTRFTIYDSYYIQLQFLNNDGEIVSEETVVYNYTE